MFKSLIDSIFNIKLRFNIARHSRFYFLLKFNHLQIFAA